MNGIATILLTCMLCVVSTNRNKTTHDNRLQVYGGRNVKEGEFPFYAAIKRTQNGNVFDRCGGSIIEENIILTAASCVNNIANTDQVKLYDSSQLLVTIGEKKLKIKNIIAHENFDVNNVNNDIALIILSDNLNFTRNVTKIALPSGSDAYIASMYDAGKPITVIGCGFMRNNVRTNKLQKLDEIIIRSDSCGVKINQTGMICSGIVGKSLLYRTANGDSGGPLFTKKQDGSFVQLALVSWMSKNKTNTTYGVSTKVSTYVPWIEHKIERLDDNISKIQFCIQGWLPCKNQNWCIRSSQWCDKTTQCDICKECNPGYEWRLNRCEKCPIGKFSLGGSQECLSCPDGTTSDTGAKSENECFSQGFTIKNPVRWKKYELKQKLEVGDVIKTSGIFSSSSGKFSVNICGSNGDIILRVVFRPRTNQLKFNSKKNGRWQQEIGQNMVRNSFQLQDNTPFKITIKVYDREYRIFLNDRELNMKFSHRQDIKTATHVYVTGRINWSEISYDKWNVVDKYKFYNIDLQNTDLQVTSTDTSGVINFGLYSDTKRVTFIALRMDTMDYKIKGCTEFSKMNNMPTDTNKTWTFVKTKNLFKIRCNGKEVVTLNYYKTFPNRHCWKILGCRDNDVTRIQFFRKDSMSQKYRPISKSYSNEEVW